MNPSKPLDSGIEGITHEPFYIGVGRDGRIFDHLKEACNSRTKDKNLHKINTIRKLIRSRELVIACPIEKNLLFKEACAMEQQLISFFGRSDLGTGPLTNMTAGGEGTPGRIVSEESRKRMREAAKMRPKVSEETRLKMSASHPKSYPKEFGEKISKTNTGRKLTNAHKQKLSEYQKGKRNPLYEWHIQLPNGEVEVTLDIIAFGKDHGVSSKSIRRSFDETREVKGFRCTQKIPLQNNREK